MTASATPDETPALVAELPAGAGKRVGVLTLNAPRTLNSLSLAMIDIIEPQLTAWAQDDRIAAVWLQGSGQRAFCAGGDIQALYRAIVAGQPDQAEAFFAREYRLDYQLRVFAKPIVVWGEGVVMGGGMGLFGGGQFRIATATSRLAMPEINIGLFADAGGTAWLASLPRTLAIWLGLTGSHLNASDARYINLATHVLAAGSREQVLAALCTLPLRADASADRQSIARLLDGQTRPELPPGNLERLDAQLEAQLGGIGTDVHAARAAVAQLAGRDEWLDTGVAALEAGCPTTAGIVLGQIERAAGMHLADMFRMETTIAAHCARNGDFAEGVRALLIDKDRQPIWRPGWDEVTADWINSHFESLWAVHPLADL